MKENLKLNGVEILNFDELQRGFSPWAIYGQLSLFCRFAAVHCVPLPLLLQHEGKDGKKPGTDAGCSGKDNSLYHAEYLRKEFWLEMIRCEDWPEAENARRCFHCIVKRKYGKKAESSELEIKDADINGKIDHICRSAGFHDQKEEIRICLILLAICELSERNALSVDFGKDGAVPDKEAEQEEEDGIMDFPDTGCRSLAAAFHPYRYWYHDLEELAENETIKTVRVEARPAQGNPSVCIELYSQESKRLIQRIKLRPGEYRYCNVAGGKIIKFLPTVSICRDVCMIREYDRSQITVYRQGEEAWVLEADTVGSFATGGRETGFLLVQNGIVNVSFYQEAKTDRAVCTKLETIIQPIVEVRILGNDYELLTEYGSVITREGIRHKERGAVSLDPYSRYPLASVNGLDVCEVAVGEGRRSVVFRKNNGEICKYYGDEGKHVTAEKKNGLTRIVIV